MHLLFISSMLPEDEPRSGFEIANRAIADAYRRQGVRLTFVGFRRPNSPLPRRNEISLGTLVPENALVGRARQLEWAWRAIRAGLPVSAAKLATMDAGFLANELAQAGPVDGYVLNSIQMPAAYPFLVREKPAIFIAHNVEHASAAENARNAGSLPRRALYWREARLLRAAERAVCAGARVVHALAADDLAGLGLGGHPAASVLPLSIGRPAVPDDGRRDFDVGLIGTWSWAPNRAGLDWFLKDVAPRLPADQRIAVAGGFDGAPPSAPPNVSFLGRVPDAQNFVRGCRVMALAARGGTGVQLKTIEALEEGMPAVATPSAMRGVSAAPANVRIADDAVAFAAALADMVAGVREGRVGRTSGLAFALAQRHALSQAVEAGLVALGVARPGARRAPTPPPAEASLPLRAVRS